MVSTRVIKFGVVTRGWGGVSWGHPHRIPMGQMAPACPKCLVPLTHAHTVWPRTTKFSTVTHGTGLFLDSQEQLLCHGMGPISSRIFFRTSNICPDGKTKSNLTWHGDQTTQEDYRSTTSTAFAIICLSAWGLTALSTQIGYIVP